MYNSKMVSDRKGTKVQSRNELERRGQIRLWSRKQAQLRDIPSLFLERNETRLDWGLVRTGVLTEHDSVANEWIL